MNRLGKMLAVRMTPIPSACGLVCLGLGLLLALFCVGPAAAEKDAEGKGEAQTGVRYDVKLEGTAGRNLRKILETVLDTRTYRDRPPASLLLLDRRAEEDLVHLRDALRSLGYYQPEVSYTISEGKDRALVIFLVHPGKIYRFENITLTGLPPEMEKSSAKPGQFGIRAGKPAESLDVVTAGENLVSAMKKEGYAFAKVAEKRVVVDHAARKVDVTYTLAPGPKARFGPTTFTGLESVREEYPRKLIPWDVGDRYNGQLVNKLQKNLVETRLFGLVRIIPAESLTADGLLPMTIELKERKHRTFAVGANYQTDVGAGGKIAWDHRNLFHEGEILSLALTGSQLTYAFEGSFRKPAFLQKNQAFVIESKLARDDFTAYTSDYYESSFLLERILTQRMSTDVRVGQLQDEKLSIGAGPTFRIAGVKTTDKYEGFPVFQDDTFLLMGIRAFLNWNTTDDLLSPTRGGRLLVQANPYYEVFSTGPFMKAFASYSRYLKVLDDPQLVLAGRVALGSIAGADRNDIPADVRFYAGGGGSIRGYPFQKVGPLFKDEPTGGRSLLEFSTELRLKVTKNIGMVAFIDGGSAFESSYPDFDQGIRWGAGTGVRYFTPVGPLRLDIAFPLQRRSGIDDVFQVYVGLGQAF